MSGAGASPALASDGVSGGRSAAFSVCGAADRSASFARTLRPTARRYPVFRSVCRSWLYPFLSKNQFFRPSPCRWRAASKITTEAAADTLSEFTPPYIGIDTTKSALSRSRRDTPFALAAEDDAQPPVRKVLAVIRLAVGLDGVKPDVFLLQLVDGRRKVGHPRHRDMLDCAGRTP